MQQEEEFWALKSRLNWAALGDHNTSFFHVTTLIRRHRNKIRSIKNFMGEWITDEEEVKNYILSEYQKLFETGLCGANPPTDLENFPCYALSEEDKDCLSTPITAEEVKQGLWSLKPFKAPGVDSLHAGFFQYFWEDVKGSVCKEVMEVFESKVVPEYLNETLFSLIPKCPNPESFNNYRSISLCNTIYKVVTKIIVARIRPFLDKLIASNQAAFVLGRRGLDNYAIAQELIHFLDNKKGKVGFMVIKVDLVKAYDRLEWPFIHKVLKAFNFPQLLIDLIMGCISSTSISILFNGGKLNSFKPSRRIRQGDPLSPYLFILCMEYLGFLINKGCMEKKWALMKASKENVEVSHLFFANNLMLFFWFSLKLNLIMWIPLRLLPLLAPSFFFFFILNKI